MSYGFLRRHTTTIAASVVILLLLTLFIGFNDQSSTFSDPTPAEKVISGGWYTIYFTNPNSPTASTLRGGPDAALAEAIDAAQYTVDMAIYHLDLWSVRDALKRAHRRGVIVRVVAESDNILEPEITDLEAAGIQVLGDRRDHLMHHKFVVIDRLEVWTGSMNFTINGAYRNNNNLIRIRSSKIAQDYVREFEEMFLEDRFSALSRSDTPYPNIRLNGTSIEIYFSPDDGIADQIVLLIKNAQENIDFLAFAFTSDAIAEAMIQKAQNGVIVRGVIEASQASLIGSEYERLHDAGLSVRLFESRGIMHHKVIVIDGTTVITGSYNLSRSAEDRNDENILVLHSTQIAEQYQLEFIRLFEGAIP